MKYSFKKTFLFLFLAIIAVAAPAPAKEKKGDLGDIKTFISSNMKRFNVPGASVLVVKDGKVILSEGFGYRDVEKKLPVDRETLFAIGSCSKAFTAYAACLLAQEGKLDLDKPLKNYYPDLQLSDPYIAANITMRDLLCHRTGFPGHDLIWYHSKASREDIVKNLKHLKFAHGFREKFHYCNPMFILAGEVIAKVSGGSWDEYIRRNILTPLGMISSNTTVEEYNNSPNHATGYKMNPMTTDVIPDNMFSLPLEKTDYKATNINTAGAAGSINSNIVDMEKWLSMQMNAGKYNGKEMMKKEIFLQMHSPQMPTGGDYDVSSPFTPADYCLGWGEMTYQGKYMVQHSGGIDGFASFVTFMPKEKIGIIILTNMDSTHFHTMLASEMYDRLLGIPDNQWSDKVFKGMNAALPLKKAALEEEEKNRKKDTTPSHPLEDYAGVYRHPAYGDLTIEFNGKKLISRINDMVTPMQHYHYDVFRAWSGKPLDPMDLKITFKMNDKGEIDKACLPLEPSLAEIEFVKVVEK